MKKETVTVDINNRIENPLDNKNVVEKAFLEQGYAVCDIKDYTEQEKVELLNYFSCFYSPKNAYLIDMQPTEDTEQWK